jgi:hypothetical protein
MPNPALSAGDIAPISFAYADAGDIGDAPPFNYQREARPAGMVWGNAGPDFVAAPPFAYGSYGPAGDIAPVRFGYAPAGAVPTSGSPAASYSAGTYDFYASILVRGAEPLINGPAFRERLAQVLRDADLATGLGGGLTGSEFALAKGAQQTENVVAPNGATRAQPAWWLNVSGRVVAPRGFQTATFEQALSRALASAGVVTWRPIAGQPNIDNFNFAVNAPQNGSSLQAVFSLPNACTGGALFAVGVPWYKACVRFGPVPVSAPATPAPAPQVTPTAPPAPSPQTGCSVVIRDYTFLRTSATFAQVGPRIPAQSTLYLLARTNLSQRASTGNTVTIYRARTVDGQNGFVVLDPQDVANANPPQCVAALPVDSSVTLNTAVPPPSPPVAPVRPAPQLPPAANQPIPGTVSQTPTSGLSTGSMLGIGLAAVAAGVGVAVATKNPPKRSLGKAKGAKGKVTARGGKTTRRR